MCVSELFSRTARECNQGLHNFLNVKHFIYQKLVLIDHGVIPHCKRIFGAFCEIILKFNFNHQHREQRLMLSKATEILFLVLRILFFKNGLEE